MRLADRAARSTSPSASPGRDDASGRLQRLTLAPDLLTSPAPPATGVPDEHAVDAHGPSHEVLTGVGQWVPFTPPHEDGPQDVGHGRSHLGRLSGAVHQWLPVTSLDAGARGVAALAVLAMLAALVAVGVAWHAAPRPAALPADRPVVQAPSAPSGSTPSGSSLAAGAARTPGSATVRVSAAPEVVVDVVGKVRRPGLVRVPAGSRVADALAAAGGAQPGTDLTAVPLARRLVDGEQVAVGVTGVAVPGASSSAGTAGGPTAAGSSGASATPADPLDLNSATVEQLDALPGVGPVLAQRIVTWRDAHGGFSSVDQLRQVSGLGGRKGQALIALVRV